MSQPAATHVLAELESLLEVELFDRHSRGMRPTALGQVVIPLARHVLQSIEACAEAVSTRRQGANALIRLGANLASISGLLARALPSFSTAHPDVVVDVVELGNDVLRALTDERALDVVIGRAPSELPPGFEFLPLMEDRYV